MAVTSGGLTTSYDYNPNSSLQTTTLPSGNGYIEKDRTKPSCALRSA